MNKVARNIQKQARKRGQMVRFISEARTSRCPCWSSDFQQPDAAWHDANPDEPACNDEGFLLAPAENTDAHVFILPYAATSRAELPQYSHFIEKLGPVRQDDHLLIAPDIPANTERLEWSGATWHVYNPIPVPVGNDIGVWLALVRRD
ncbi:hypothetical protein [Brevibacillus centrosporus]|uniref:hypothetical protein n=1 Tax=Brevibacillus centrosporus TaxID=54910 RepID=UPI002E245154|nr:hypothetical protein [Brevibacillus centrosporus]